ncbi:MAG: peptidoglycan DD-metalloendopeptidase family protein [Pseudomonadota bacterium]
MPFAAMLRCMVLPPIIAAAMLAVSATGPAFAPALAPAHAQTPPAPRPVPSALLDDARRALEEARLALERGGSGAARLAALGAAVSAQEKALAAYRDASRQLSGRAAALAKGIAAERERIGELIAVLQSLSSAPKSALFAYPGGPVRAARASMLLAAVTPALEERRAALATELRRLGEVRVAEAVARAGATSVLTELQDLRAETAIALEERRRSLPPQRLMAAQARNAARDAESLAALAETLERVLGGAPAGPGFEGRRGRLPLPVSAASITGQFGDNDPWGNPGAGLTLAAPPFSQVASPVDATLRYAGPLPGYGTVAILEPESGWLLTLAGLGRIDRKVGETVRAGERLGDLGRDLPESSEILLAPQDGDDLITPAQLYLELRQEGVPVDPAPWFAPTDSATGRP